MTEKRGDRVARRPRFALLTALLAFGVVAASAGCSESNELPTWSLRIGPGTDELNCADPGVRSTRALGAVWVTNLGESPITIRSVEPVAPRDVEVDAAFLIPDGGRWYTVAGEIPPPAQGDGSAADAWERKVALDEGVIQPGELWQIVQPVRTLSDDASFEATRVEYEEDGTLRAGQDRTALSVAGAPECS